MSSIRRTGCVLALLSAAVIGEAGAAETNPVFDKPEPAQFAQVGATAESVTYRTIPAKWLVDDWHRLGVKVYALVAPEEDESPALFRMRFGFQVFRSGVDGVRWGGKDADRPFYESAMKAAEDDMKLVRTLDELAARAMASQDALVRTAGREAKVYAYIVADFDRSSAALARRELVVRIRKVQKALGEPPMAAPADIPDAAPRPFVPPADAKTVEAKYDAEILPGLKFNLTGRDFSFTIPGDYKLKAGTWPGVKRAFTLYIPTGRKNDWLVFKFSCDLTDDFGRASVEKPAPRVNFYTLEPRFYETSGMRYQVRPMQPASREHPAINHDFAFNSPLHCYAGASHNWYFPFRCVWNQLVGCQPRAGTRWYVKEGDQVVCIWFKTTPDCFSGLLFAPFVGGYENDVNAAIARWSYEDPVFCDACVRPLAEANTELVAALKKRIQPNQYIDWAGSDKFVRQKAAKNQDKLAFFKYDVAAARVKYLDEILAGRTVKVPERKKKSEAKAAGPDLDDEDGDMKLDDSEY